MESSPQAAEAGPIKPPRTCRRASRCPLLAGCPLHSYGDAAAKAALTTELLWFIFLPSHPESPSISFTSHSFPKHLQPLLVAGSRISPLSSTIALGTVSSIPGRPSWSKPTRAEITPLSRQRHRISRATSLSKHGHSSSKETQKEKAASVARHQLI